MCNGRYLSCRAHLVTFKVDSLSAVDFQLKGVFFEVFLMPL